MHTSECPDSAFADSSDERRMTCDFAAAYVKRIYFVEFVAKGWLLLLPQRSSYSRPSQSETSKLEPVHREMKL